VARGERGSALGQSARVDYGDGVSDSTWYPPVDPAALPPLADLGHAGDPGAGGDLAVGLRIRTRVLAALAAEGLPAVVDEDGDVAVDVGDQTVFVSVFATVPPFLRVFGSWLVEGTPADELRFLRAANAVTGAINLVKVTVHGDAIVVAADLLLPAGGAELDDDTVAALVTSTIDAVLGAAQTWHAMLDELRQEV
jgi:hypothetical protein